MNIPANPTALKVETHSNFVDGRQIEAGDGTLLDVHNPATGEVIARIPNSTSADIDRAMKSARAASRARNGAAWISAAARGW